jgi:chromosome segregation ATPase
MEKYKNIISIVLLLAAGVIIYQLMAGNSNLQKAVSTLEDTQQKLKQAAAQVDFSKKQVDSLQQSFVRFGAYIHDIQGRLERLDLEKRLSEQSFANKRDSIKARLKELNKNIELTGDALPEEVVVIDTRNQGIR